MDLRNSFDLIVLGAGSGGLAAAKRAALHGARVAIVEGDLVGGTCVIRGCVPKKILVYGSMYGEYLRNAPAYGVQIESSMMESSVLLENIQREVIRLSDLHKKFLSKSGVDLISGWGEFSDHDSILVRDKRTNHILRDIQSKYILIAVGGKAVRPSVKGSELGWVSDDIFLLKSFPKKIVIVGGGFIACEFSCIFNGLGVEVTQLVRGNSLLRGFDSELGLGLQDSMEKKGISLKFSESVSSIKGNIGNLKITTNLGSFIESEGLLFAVGRQPLLNDLRLDLAKVFVEKNRIKVDKKNKTNVSNVFAIGDVTDRLNLTPVAVDEGRAFADRTFSSSKRIVNYENVPCAVFSQPEIATVGMTEELAVEKLGKENIKIYRSRFKPLSKSLPKTGSSCLLKLVVEANTEKILGCHMIGENAAEIIQMAAVSLLLGAKKSDFDNTMALHPTIAEEFVTMT